MRASRLLSILMLLQLRGRVAASALAREFEVSVRTIYRDLDALSAAGVPVYAERGRHGGLALHPGWRSSLTGLTDLEARTLPLAGLAAAARDLGLGGEAAAARLKMMASLPPEAGAGAQRVAERFHLDALPWYHRAEVAPCLPALAAAVWDDRLLRVEYEGWKGGVRRQLSPLGLVLKGGLWYLVALAGSRPRTYRVANIRRLEVLEGRFRRPPDFDLAAFWPRWVDDFERRLLAGSATVRLSEEGLRILRAERPLAAERVQATQRRCARRGWVEAELPIESVAYSARQLLRLGAECEVIAPAALRRAVAAEAARVARLNRQPSSTRS
ncbi:MAG: WYL domain-containing protein [Rubrivivax sp.]